MHVVAAVIDEGALTFDLAIPCEVFGLDRSDIATPWYEFQPGTKIVSRSARQRAGDGSSSGSLRRAHERGARIVSLCTGAFALAEAGLLAGRRATTHWMYADRLAARHPDIEVDPDVLYVVDGQIMTSAGTAAGIDLCLHIADSSARFGHTPVTHA